MLKRIYLKRYGKTLIAFAILIFGLYFLNAHGTVSSWHAQNKYYHSSDFERSFKEQPESFTYWDDKLEKDMTYTSIKEYISDQLYVYGRALIQITTFQRNKRKNIILRPLILRDLVETLIF